MHPQPLICVRDVEASSRWYQRLVGCERGHGGREYERLVSNGRLILQLHRWDIRHHHDSIADPNLPLGNAAVARALQLQAEIVLPRHRNQPDGDGGPNHWEIRLRDPDGYTVVLTSPDGTADGNWKP